MSSLLVAGDLNIKASETNLPPEPLHLAALHNAFALGNNIFSGSSPHDEKGFKALQDLGIKTVLSVDGAKPNLELAKQFGLRYVHLPSG